MYMAEGRTRVDRVLYRIDGFRGLLGLLLAAVIAVAAIRAGGTAGWVFGVLLLALCAAGGIYLIRRRA
jgi:hypothetical protein